MEPMSSRVLVLGATGMLGSTIVRRFHEAGFDVTATARRTADLPDGIALRTFDVEHDEIASIVADFGVGDTVINCIGVIRHLMKDDVAADRLRAIRINAEFPYALAAAAETQGFRVLQIATDCVYSGLEGAYDETAVHDAYDVYGKTKSLGETPSPQVLHLRCSIIGTELGSATSLLEWVRSQPIGATLNGFTDHRWNGVTTDAFADVAVGLVRSRSTLSGVQHLIPADALTKDELVKIIAKAFGRDDLDIRPVSTGTGVDRTLSTISPEISRQLWSDADYDHPPTIAEMVGATATVHA